MRHLEGFMRRRTVFAWVGVPFVLAACSNGAGDANEHETAATLAAPDADRRVAGLRARFDVPAPTVTALEVSEGRAHPVLRADAVRGTMKAARVDFPLAGNGSVSLTDQASKLSVSFALRGASEVPLSFTQGLAIYAGAFDDGDVVHRAHAEGTEDYVLFEERPEREELLYDVDVSHVAGLRLVANTLEFLDDGGTPRLRVAPPYVLDAEGLRHEAKLEVQGCAVDTDPRAPWGRRVLGPGAAACEVRVSWTLGAYPALVDPSWSTTGSLANGRYSHTGTLLGSGQVLIAGGWKGGSIAAAELYDPGTGTFAATGGLTFGRYSCTATMLASGKVLVAGGAEVSLAFPTMTELYDPATGTFSNAGTLTRKRSNHTATLLSSGLLLLAGGDPGTSPAGDRTTSAELFDPATGTSVETTEPLVNKRLNHAAILLANGQVLLVGGYNGNDPMKSTELYDPVADAFTTHTLLGTARYHATAAVLSSGQILIAGGSGNLAPVASTELYDPVTQTFTAGPTMATIRTGHTGTLLPSGKVLVVGGNGGGNSNPKLTELYDPVSGFTAAGQMASGREFHAATLLASGEVLVTGGLHEASQVTLSAAEIFEPSGPCDTVVCTALDGCHDPGVCNPATGVCSNPAKADGAPCDDDDECTQVDICVRGQCLGADPVTCDPAPDACHEAGVCDPLSGSCDNAEKPDGSPCPGGECTAGVCAPASSSGGGGNVSGTGGGGADPSGGAGGSGPTGTSGGSGPSANNADSGGCSFHGQPSRAVTGGLFVALALALRLLARGRSDRSARDRRRAYYRRAPSQNASHSDR
jgi:hypothetical protein